MAKSKPPVPLAGTPAPSSTVTVYSVSGVWADGLPDIAPVAAFSPKPCGRLGETLHCKGASPPGAGSVVEYALPAVGLGKVSVAGKTGQSFAFVPSSLALGLLANVKPVKSVGAVSPSALWSVPPFRFSAAAARLTPLASKSSLSTVCAKAILLPDVSLPAGWIALSPESMPKDRRIPVAPGALGVNVTGWS